MGCVAITVWGTFIYNFNDGSSFGNEIGFDLEGYIWYCRTYLSTTLLKEFC